MEQTIVKIDQHTWRIEDGHVRYFLLEGKEKAALIDSGISGPGAKGIAESLTDLPIILLNTHGDVDHVAGNGEFEAFYMTEADYKNCHIGEKFPNSKWIPLNDGDRIDLGDRMLEIVCVPGHTFGSVAVLDVNSRSLISGDMVQTGQIFMFGPHRNPEGLKASLIKLMDMEARYDRFYPSHSDPELPAGYEKEVLTSWKAVCAGEVAYDVIELFGTKVKSYRTDKCGFFCNLAE